MSKSDETLSTGRRGLLKDLLGLSAAARAADAPRIEYLKPEGLFNVPSFSQVTTATGGKLVFVSGQVAHAMNPDAFARRGMTAAHRDMDGARRPWSSWSGRPEGQPLQLQLPDCGGSAVAQHCSRATRQ